MSNNNNLTDFGEKIGGARKDLWASRGLIVSDLDDMNEREANKFVIKDNIWKRPNYETLAKTGIPVEILYWRNEIRKAVNAKPNFFYYDGDKERGRKDYIETVRLIESLCNAVKTAEDAVSFFEKFYIENGYMEKDKYLSGYTYTLKGRHDPALSNKLYRVSCISSPQYLVSRYKNKAKREQFALSKAEKLPKGVEIHFYDGNGYSRNKDWEQDTYYVVQGCYIIKTNFKSKEEAFEWVKENFSSTSSSKKKKFTPPQLEHIERSGPNYRSGVEIDGNNYLETFGFRGGEFGNWLNQNDRQVSMNMGFEALKDLANALHISDYDIALNGSLAIAFGARGHGKAVAHYEPLRKVINLTKMRGAGSLAHEWWHALDDYLGSVVCHSGSFLSDISYKYSPMDKLLDAIMLRMETEDEAKEREKRAKEAYKKSDAQTIRNAESWVDHFIKKIKDKCLDSDSNGIEETCANIKQRFMDGKEGSVQELNLLCKDITKHVIPKKDRETLLYFVHRIHWINNSDSTSKAEEGNSSPKCRKTKSEYYKNSKKMDNSHQKDGDYWACNKELTARAFACYIKDKLGYKSDYLVGHAETCVSLEYDSDGNSELIKAYPVGEERKAINAAFDNLFLELKKDGYLTHTDKIKALPKHKEDNSLIQLSLFELLSAPI